MISAKTFSSLRETKFPSAKHIAPKCWKGSILFSHLSKIYVHSSREACKTAKKLRMAMVLLHLYIRNHTIQIKTFWDGNRNPFWNWNSSYENLSRSIHNSFHWRISNEPGPKGPVLFCTRSAFGCMHNTEYLRVIFVPRCLSVPDVTEFFSPHKYI